MTRIATTLPSTKSPRGGPGILPATLAGLAVAACTPYVALKVLWLTGSTIGLTDASLAQSKVMDVANLGTLVMALAAAALAVALILPVGHRIPAWLLVPPMYIGTGLLGGLLVALPLQLAIGRPGPDEAARDGAPLADWVYLTVYAGFAALGVCLLSIFTLHAWHRWVTPAGWTERLGKHNIESPRHWFAPLGSGALMLMFCIVELAATTRAGLPGAQSVMATAMGSVACLGLVMLALRLPAKLPGWVPMVMVYAGSAAVAAWGLYLSVVLAVPNPLGGGIAVPDGLPLLQAGRAVAGTLVVLALTRIKPRIGSGPGAELRAGTSRSLR